MIESAPTGFPTVVIMMRGRVDGRVSETSLVCCFGAGVAFEDGGGNVVVVRREREAGMSSVVRDECMAVHAFMYRSVQCKV
jgi:hypothetical protein